VRDQDTAEHLDTCNLYARDGTRPLARSRRAADEQARNHRDAAPGWPALVTFAWCKRETCQMIQEKAAP